ncbi:MAG: phenylalanine--tRNA ligase, alpha subunit [Parcubacteria bacterium C7867-003]|nr:MAG: phenylalanine--tRNA ligase, alpha subunit [Parcubacteria bacterium C7867-003]
MEQEVKKEPHSHPLTLILQDVNRIFNEMGFTVADGPEVETEFYNFDTLNIPEHHPARDMWDTFWLKPLNARKLLRTHTSPVQVRFMEANKPPIKIIAPGKVFRHEATDATHEAQFYQLEGLVVGENVSLANLKWTLEEFFEKLFGKKTGIRFRPSYFPFVEPGVEIDMTCFKCGGQNSSCNVCKGTGFIEIMGAGLVHPKVLESSGIDSKKYSGFAFGCGVDRLVMLKYGVDDVRLLYQGDLRLVNQF